MEKYRNWNKGKYELERREIDQLAFRLMKQFEMDTIYGVDANSFARDLSRSKDSTAVEEVMKRVFSQQDESLYENAFEDRYWDWYDQGDVDSYKMNLLDYFQQMNSKEEISLMHGHYILSDQTTDYNAVDALMLNWYSRNLRIIKNIQMVEKESNDRILVLFGAGHAAILKQQLESSPEYELIEFNSL